VLAELEEMNIGLISGYSSSSLKEFWIGSHSPPLVAFSGPSTRELVIQLVVDWDESPFSQEQ
jgi:hypothetical protein